MTNPFLVNESFDPRLTTPALEASYLAYRKTFKVPVDVDTPETPVCQLAGGHCVWVPMNPMTVRCRYCGQTGTITLN